MKAIKPLVDRFWKKVDVRGEDDCWEWTGTKTRTGYGQIGRGRRGEGMEYAHRASWQIHNGPIPEGMDICHKCDNPSCVNPRHLFIAPRWKNVRDMIAKGRQIGGPNWQPPKSVPRKPRKTPEMRLWEKIDKRGPDECWEWQGYKLPFGHGQFRYEGETQLAHRVVYSLTRGEILEGKCVLHTCDNPSCCNPRHLWLGDRDDNNRDMREKGRGHNPPVHFGNDNNMTNLTEDDVRFIRASDLTLVKLAERFNVTKTCISSIRHGATWGWVDPDKPFVTTKRDKVSPDDVRGIRALLKEGKLLQREIGDIYGVSGATVCLINKGKIWKDVT